MKRVHDLAPFCSMCEVVLLFRKEMKSREKHRPNSKERRNFLGKLMKGFRCVIFVRTNLQWIYYSGCFNCKNAEEANHRFSKAKTDSLSFPIVLKK